jgi:uncharacterized repeat protein (TIGR01451 family)
MPSLSAMNVASFIAAHARRLFSFFFRVILSALMLVLPFWAQAQTVYGVGDASGGGTTYNRLFSVNPATGAATNLCALSFQSAAMAVSPVNGLSYYFEYDVANPRMNTINPTGCVNGTAVSTTLATGVIRATFCPDGRLFASTSTNQFFELNPATGAITRTLNFNGMPTGGSGDFTCVNNGDFYIVANTTNGSNGYSLFRIAGATLRAAANNANVAVTTIGALNLTGTPNGISEVTQNLASCAAAPNPCLIVSTGTTNQTWGVDVLTGDADNIGTTGHTLADLSRSFPLDVSIVKSVSPADPLQGQTITYSLLVSNQGPGLAQAVTVTDVFSAGTFSSIAWTCSVVSAGSPTVVPTACGSASGTGNINHTVSLSNQGSVLFTVSAKLTPTFTGSVSNVGRATLTTALLTETNTANNTSSTASSSVSPATLLTVAKTNGETSQVAGETTTYTITIANQGPGAAPGAMVRDSATPGLSCSTVTCSATSGASCPAASFPFADLASGVQISPTFAAGSTATFVVTCGVTATGL